MPNNVAIANIVSGATGVVSATPQDIACEVFKTAVDTYCGDKKKGKTKGKFNDYYFKALKKKESLLRKQGSLQRGQALIPNKQREFPLGLWFADGSVSSYADLAKQAGSVGEAASEALAAIAGRKVKLAKMDAQRGGWATKLRSIFEGRLPPGKSIQQPMFPDAMLGDGSAFEIKGPGDVENPKGQPGRYAEMAPSKRCVVVTCESCGTEAECKNCGK